MANATHDLNDIKRRMQGATRSLKKELGRPAHRPRLAALARPGQVEAYGSHMPLNQVATVSVPEPRHDLGPGLGPLAGARGRKGDRRFQSRPVAVDRRSDVALAHSRAQRGAAQGTRQGRAQICRGRARRGAPCAPRRPRSVKKLEKDHKISEDDHERFTGDVQKATDQASREIDQMLASKEKEIMTV